MKQKWPYLIGNACPVLIQLTFKKVKLQLNVSQAERNSNLYVCNDVLTAAEHYFT